MVDCRHRRLEALPEKTQKLRCSYCHLVISREELADSFCPECYEVRGVRHDEFEEMKGEDERKIRYRCEECGAVIEWEGLTGDA